MDLGIDGLGKATEIGAGGSAVVYRAYQARLDRDVAVKVLTLADPAFVRRFEREARTLGKLSQKPGIVTVYDTGLTASGQPYLVLELCPSSLQDRLNQVGRMDPRNACSLLTQVAGAVDTAHRQGVIHRDLKPGNILLTSDHEPLVTDFGIATVSGTTMGQTTSVGFTPGYVAPETLQGQNPEEPADVYALGATLFQMLVGYLPFDDGRGNTNLLALVYRVSDEPLPDLRREGVPEPVVWIIEAAMAKDPARRPSARRLQEYLQTASRGGFPDFDADHGPGPRGGRTNDDPMAGAMVAGLYGRDPGPASGRPPPVAGREAGSRPGRGPGAARPHTPQPLQPLHDGRQAAGQPPVTDRQRPTPPPAPASAASRPPSPASPPVYAPRAPEPESIPATHGGCLLRSSLAFARGFLAALLVFIVGLILYLVGSDSSNGTDGFDSGFETGEQAGAVETFGLTLLTVGPFVAFVLGAFWFPWPRIKR